MRETKNFRVRENKFQSNVRFAYKLRRHFEALGTSDFQRTLRLSRMGVLRAGQNHAHRKPIVDRKSSMRENRKPIGQWRARLRRYRTAHFTCNTPIHLQPMWGVHVKSRTQIRSRRLGFFMWIYAVYCLFVGGNGFSSVFGNLCLFIV